VRAKRAAQAESLALMVDRRLAPDPTAPLLVVGDMNAFEFSDGYVDVVGTVRGTPAPRDQVVQPTRDLLTPDLINLVDGLPAPDRYSYVFDGVAQTLDHVLVSPGLLESVAAFGHVRGNADAPEIWRSDATRPERISDHDPALVYLRLR
jgi:predicted extracellular nuclease